MDNDNDNTIEKMERKIRELYKKLHECQYRLEICECLMNHVIDERVRLNLIEYTIDLSDMTIEQLIDTEE